MLPYFAYGLIYATTEYIRVSLGGAGTSYITYLREYLLFAGWHGYFLVVAMQFYIFFWLYNRFRLWTWLPSERWLIPASLISMAWWGYFRWYDIEPTGLSALDRAARLGLPVLPRHAHGQVLPRYSQEPADGDLFRSRSGSLRSWDGSFP